MTRMTNPASSQRTNDDPVKKAWEDFVLKGIPTDQNVRPEVIDSWRQCLDIGLDPHSQNSPPILSAKKLQQLLHQNQDLIEISKPVMHMIEISVRSTGFIVTLSDHVGYVLKVYGDQEILKMAEENFYVPGCLRSVQHAGTNAIGLCLDIKKPIQLTGAEHFKTHHHPWTCSSAPIHDSQGRIAGAITLSGRSVGQHQHTLALVTAAADTIKTQLRERNLIVEKQRLNSMLTTIYHSISDGIVAVDSMQRITHMNRIAADMLGMEQDAALGRHLNDALRPDQNLLQAINAKRYFHGNEASFHSPEGPRSYICSLDALNDADGQELGTIIKLSEKRKMINIAQKIGGNYAKYDFDDIKGKNPELQRQIQMARIAANTQSRILIIGESGTGKELFAQAIHSQSNRRNEPFVALSCAAIPRDLIESELFGYRGGAFTGARRNGMMGKFEFANKGTLFLDEINSLPSGAQAKLLRVLQQNEIVRLGDNQPIAIDVRVIAASSVDLLEEVENHNFREDLYYRLNIVEIFIPPLRERTDDLELLIDHILRRQCEKYGFNKAALSKATLDIMNAYDWPGNIRELENAMARALMLSQGETIQPQHLPMRPRKRTGKLANERISLREGYRQIIEATLQECGGNVSEAARQLQVARSTLYRKMNEFGIS